jgi:hypothetical protein
MCICTPVAVLGKFVVVFAGKFAYYCDAAPFYKILAPSYIILGLEPILQWGSLGDLVLCTTLNGVSTTSCANTTA